MTTTTTTTTTTNTGTAPLPDRTPQRVRHPLRLRRLTVLRTRPLSPHMLRVTLGGPELQGFESPGFDDHVKVFFPDPATGVLHLPAPDAGPDAPRPVMRDYTPQHFDPVALTLDIDFALHDAGPATTWARQAQPGQALGIGGPRGSFIVPTAFDGHLLVGDDTALPAIRRRLAELPAGAPALVVVEVESPPDEQPLESAARLQLVWVHRRGRPHGSALLERLPALPLPQGDLYAWVACEYSTARALRTHLVEERGVAKAWIKAASYWRAGRADSHERIED